jgi:hypothetical protein
MFRKPEDAPMNLQSTLCALLWTALCCLPAPAGAADSGPDFMLGTWTRDGDCKDGQVIARTEGDKYRTRIEGRNYVGTIEREGDVIKADFAADDGNTRRYTYEIDNDNRVHVTDFVLCDQVHCEAMHVQSYLYFMRCAQ